MPQNRPERVFVRGRPVMFAPMRASAGEAPETARLEAAAGLLGREVFFVDSKGYECEILDAAVNSAGDIAYVESRAKLLNTWVDVSIRVHHLAKNGGHDSEEIESYNPFFGCDVRFLSWIGRTAILIYREKHWTYACRFGDLWPPRFVKIGDDWAIAGTTLEFRRRGQAAVGRLSFPELDILEAVPEPEGPPMALFLAPAEQFDRKPEETASIRKRSWFRKLFGGHR